MKTRVRIWYRKVGTFSNVNSLIKWIAYGFWNVVILAIIRNEARMLKGVREDENKCSR